MSRWFKIVMVIMAVFVIRMAIKVSMNKPTELDVAIKADVIYNAYQLNAAEAEEMYGGAKVTIEGIIVDVVGSGTDFKLILSDFGSSGNQIPMVECYPWKMRRYKSSYYDPGMTASITGRIREDQQSGVIKIDNCQIIAI
jgi:hypothetical protein